MRKAFTLLEMLVVIGIISILVAIATVSYSSAQKKARDAKRKGDLDAAQKMMEECYAANTTNPYKYPTITTLGTIQMSSIPTGCTNFSITDPVNSGLYVYSATSDTTNNTYSITAVLENGSVFVVNNQQ